MKLIYKILSIPFAILPLSATIEPDPILKMVGLQIESENENHFLIRAYGTFTINDVNRECNYVYYWLDENNNRHNCGAFSFYLIKKGVATPFQSSLFINKGELDGAGLVTFVCEADVTRDTTYFIKMKYNSKGNGIISFNEKDNNTPLSSGYVLENINPYDSNLNYHYEDFITFLNYEDIVVNEFYYDFDISYLRFKYENYKDNILKGEFIFSFLDKYNYFSSFPIDDVSMYRNIPLTLNQDNDEYYFTFTPLMYYDPETHVCSLEPIEGYLKTNHLMLPFAGEDDLKLLPCLIKLNINGFMKPFKVESSFTLTYIKKHHSDDDVESEFYTEIHQDEEKNINERIVEVSA